MDDLKPPMTDRPAVSSPSALPSETSLFGVSQNHRNNSKAISIEEPHRASSTSDPNDPTSSVRGNSSGPAARRRTNVPAHANSTHSHTSNRDNTPGTPATAGRSLTLQSMGLLKDKKPDGSPRWKEPTLRECLRSIVFASWLNVLIIFVPVSWALHFALDKEKSSNDTVIFITCFLAIIPLAKLLAWGTEEIALRVGQTLGGLLNATFGNVVELIVGVIALAQCKLNVVQSSLIGSILSNLLLVLGMCFFAGGTRFAEQGFIQTTAQLNTSLLILSVTAILIPAAFHVAIANANAESGGDVDSDQSTDILKMSHGVALILLVIYAGSLIFQLWSHAHLYADKGEYAPMKSTRYPKAPPRDPNNPGKVQRAKNALNFRKKKGTAEDDTSSRSDSPLAPTTGTTSATAPNGGVSRVNTAFAGEGNGAPLETVDEEGLRNSKNGHAVTDGNGDLEARAADAGSETDEDEEEEETPLLTLWAALGLLAVVTVLVAVTAEFLVSSIDGLTATGNISEEWVGLILLPIVGNAAEHVTAVTVSVKDKLDLSIGVAVGSSIQIALFVIPILVLLGWIMGKPLTLLFDPFESIVLFLSVLTVAFCINDGRSNWLEGLILMSLYVILGTAFWFYPAITRGNC